MCHSTVFALFHFEFEGSFRVQAAVGSYLEGRFIRGFFALRVWRAYTWRGLFACMHACMHAYIHTYIHTYTLFMLEIDRVAVDLELMYSRF